MQRLLFAWQRGRAALRSSPVHVILKWKLVIISKNSRTVDILKAAQDSVTLNSVYHGKCISGSLRYVFEDSIVEAKAKAKASEHWSQHNTSKSLLKLTVKN